MLWLVVLFVVALAFWAAENILQDLAARGAR